MLRVLALFEFECVNESWHQTTLKRPLAKINTNQDHRQKVNKQSSDCSRGVAKNEQRQTRIKPVRHTIAIAKTTNTEITKDPRTASINEPAHAIANGWNDETLS
jgi:ribosomal protein L29